MDSSQIALRLTEKAIQNGMLKKYISEDSKSASDTAKVIANFYNSLAESLCPEDHTLEIRFSDEVKEDLLDDEQDESDLSGEK